ncbi:MAG TPA: DUF2249 domain-containing protein [Gemmatimonadaceae bacterium]
MHPSVTAMMPSPELDTVSPTESPAHAPAEAAAVGALTRAFVQACRQLGKTGHPSDAMRIAAQGWSALWTSHPDDAERINGVMHYLARLEQQLAAADDQTQQGASMPTQDRVIDIRPETPKRRHEIIFDTFDALPPGSAYVIVNDHDPKPLWYQFAAEHAGEFTWDALEEGPEVWRVRIGRVAKS